MDEIPGVHAVDSQRDLLRLWRELVGTPSPRGPGLSEPGAARPSLWFVIIEPDGTLTRRVIPIDEVPDLPDARGLGALMSMLRELVATSGEGTSVAFLRLRPGRSRITRADRAWARGLALEARAAGLPTWPVNLATDESVVVIAPDDLAEDTPA